MYTSIMSALAGPKQSSLSVCAMAERAQCYGREWHFHVNVIGTRGRETGLAGCLEGNTVLQP